MWSRVNTDWQILILDALFDFALNTPRCYLSILKINFIQYNLMNSRIICLMVPICQELCKKLNKYLMILLSMVMLFNDLNYFMGSVQTFY